MKKRNDRQKSDINTVQETTIAQDLVIIKDRASYFGCLSHFYFSLWDRKN